MPVERIVWNNILFAVVIRKEVPFEQTTFFTDFEEEFQLGLIVGQKGSFSPKHHHVKQAREIESTCEALIVRKGACPICIHKVESSKLSKCN